jgi:hypothetical protein
MVADIASVVGRLGEGPGFPKKAIPLTDNLGGNSKNSETLIAGRYKKLIKIL